MTPLRYVVVSPVRDEGRFLPQTAAGLVAQTRPPRQWVIVNDGSADDTGRVADALAAGHPWVSVIHRPRVSDRARGAPVVGAFHEGLRTLDDGWDVVVKLDGDLGLPSHYFEWVMAVFERLPRAGLVGGVLDVFDGSAWVPDNVGRTTVHGAVKAYRREAFADIGGLSPSMGWDGIDEFALRSRGWGVHPISELRVLHYKQRGSSQRWWRARVEEGRGMHFMGYGVAGVVLRVGYRVLTERPPMLGGLAIAAGLLEARVRGRPVTEDALASAALRAEHRRRLLRLLTGRRDLGPVPLPGGGPAWWALDERSHPSCR